MQMLGLALSCFVTRLLFPLLLGIGSHGKLLKDVFYLQWTCYPSDELKLNFQPKGDQRARLLR